MNVSLLILLCLSPFLLLISVCMIKAELPYLRRAHKADLLRERSDLIRTTAEILGIYIQGNPEVEQSQYGRHYVMNVQYTTEEEFRKVWHNADICLSKNPNMTVGQKIDILYNPDDPSDMITVDNLEGDGLFGRLGKLAILILGFIAFVLLDVFFGDRD